MMRISSFAIALCLGFVACGRVPPPAKLVDEHAVPTKELPKEWDLDEIVDAMPPRSDDGPTHVLAWKIIEDNRPWRVDYCLAIKQLRNPTEKQEHWVLASLARAPRNDKDWHFVTIWITPDPEFTNPSYRQGSTYMLPRYGQLTEQLKL